MPCGSSGRHRRRRRPPRKGHLWRRCCRGGQLSCRSTWSSQRGCWRAAARACRRGRSRSARLPAPLLGAAPSGPVRAASAAPGAGAAGMDEPDSDQDPEAAARLLVSGVVILIPEAAAGLRVQCPVSLAKRVSVYIFFLFWSRAGSLSEKQKGIRVILHLR